MASSFSAIYDDEKIENLLPAMQKVGAFLKAEGFTLKEAGKTTGAYGCTVNRCHFARDQENVFVSINRPGEQREGGAVKEERQL
jgi:hypothetical protein